MHFSSVWSDLLWQMCQKCLDKFSGSGWNPTWKLRTLSSPSLFQSADFQSPQLVPRCTMSF